MAIVSYMVAFSMREREKKRERESSHALEHGVRIGEFTRMA